MNVEKILQEKGRDVVTAGLETSLRKIVTTLARRKIGAIVITGDDGVVSGIISERDVVRCLAESGDGVLGEPVSRHMTKHVVTCSMSDTVAELMSSMTAGRFRHLPAVENGQLVGIVSIGDVVKERIAEAEHEAEAMREYIATA